MQGYQACACNLSSYAFLQEANCRATPGSPGRAAKQPQASTTSANAQQQIRKRNAAAKKKLQEDLAEQTALVEKLQQQLAVATAEGDQVAGLPACCCSFFQDYETPALSCQ